MPLISIIIPLYNSADFTRLCLEYLPLSCSKQLDYEVILVDNASSDHTSVVLNKYAQKFQFIRNSTNLGFARACNQGAQIAKGEYLVFLNNDTVPQSGWLASILNEFETHPDTGITGSKLVYPNRTIQHAGVVFFTTLLPYHCYLGFPDTSTMVNKRRPFAAVTGACLSIRKSLFQRVGGFDERYINGLEDIDLCLQIGQLNYKCMYLPSSELIHFESRSPGRQDSMVHNRAYFLDRWGKSINPDDFRYYIEDNHVLYYNSEKDLLSALPKEEYLSMSRPLIQVALDLEKSGNIQEAFKCYRNLLMLFPYSIFVITKFISIGKAMNLNQEIAVALNRLSALYNPEIHQFSNQSALDELILL